MNTRKLAYLCLEAPREGQASYVHVTEIIAGLERRGWTVTLYAPSYSNRWERPRLVLRLLQYVRLQLQLAFMWRSYDAIYVRAHPFAFITAILARLTRKPIVHEINGPYEDLYVVYPGVARWRHWLDGLQRWQFQSAKALIAVTDKLAQWLRKETEGKAVSIVTIPNGANTIMFHPTATTDRSLPDRYAVFCGGLTKWHGVGTMLSAVQSSHWPADLALVIVGEGPESPAVLAAAAGDPRIIALGRLQYHDVPGVVAKASVGLVMISDPNGRSTKSGVAPLKLYEVLACGVPVVVSELPGMADFIREHCCGIVVSVNDAEALASAVARLTADLAQAKAMGLSGQTVVCNKHSWDSRAADTAALLSVLCDN